MNCYLWRQFLRARPLGWTKPSLDLNLTQLIRYDPPLRASILVQTPIFVIEGRV